MKVLLFVSSLLFIFTYIKAECDNTHCPSDLAIRNHMCIGEKTFKLCRVANSLPEDQIFKCPEGTVCTNDAKRCVRGQPAVCKFDCGVCDPKNHITCLSKLVFAICVDGKADPNMNGTCAADEICRASDPAICANNWNDMKPSCDQDEIYQIPENDEASPKVFCQKKNKKGAYPAGDAECKKYIACYPFDGKMSGGIFTCPDNSLFDCQKQTCGSLCNTTCN